MQNHRADMDMRTSAQYANLLCFHDMEISYKATQPH